MILRDPAGQEEVFDFPLPKVQLVNAALHKEKPEKKKKNDFLKAYYFLHLVMLITSIFGENDCILFDGKNFALSRAIFSD